MQKESENHKCVICRQEITDRMNYTRTRDGNTIMARMHIECPTR